MPVHCATTLTTSTDVSDTFFRVRVGGHVLRCRARTLHVPHCGGNLYTPGESCVDCSYGTHFEPSGRLVSTPADDDVLRLRQADEQRRRALQELQLEALLKRGLRTLNRPRLRLNR